MTNIKPRYLRSSLKRQWLVIFLPNYVADLIPRGGGAYRDW